MLADVVVVAAHVALALGNLPDERRSLQPAELRFSPKDGEIVEIGRQDVVIRLEERVTLRPRGKHEHNDLAVVRDAELLLDLHELLSQRRRSCHFVRDHAPNGDLHETVQSRQLFGGVDATHVRSVHFEVEVWEVSIVLRQPLQEPVERLL